MPHNQKYLHSKIRLLTPSQNIIVPVQVTYEDDENIAEKNVEISLRHNDVIYTGIGTDYLWVDAFVDLQNKLPKDVKLGCCMTCRHGNMCPFGNGKNELFCTKDVSINCKEDMCNLLSDISQFDKRSVMFFDYCDDFVYQTMDHYTYSDFRYFMRKKEETL